MWEYAWLQSTSNPAVFGSENTLSSLHLTWSSSEVWSYTIWRREEDWGPLSKGTLIPAGCISLHPETVLRWTNDFVFQTLWWLPGLTGIDWQKRGERFDVCGWDVEEKTNRRFFYLRGHPQSPVEDYLTKPHTKLKVKKGKEKSKTFRWFAQSTEDKQWDIGC